MDVTSLRGPTWIKPGELAVLVGYSPRHLANLADEGMPSRIGARGREYQWPACREWLRDYHQRQAIADALGGTPAPDSREAAQARLANAQADKIEYDLAIKRREYLSVAYHLREMERMAGRLVAPLGALGAQYRERSLGLTPETVDAFWAVVEDELRAHLRDAVAAGGDEEDPAEGDDRLAQRSDDPPPPPEPPAPPARRRRRPPSNE